MVLAVVAWFAGQLGASLHDLQTLHLQCMEHGHTIERAVDAPHDPVARNGHDELREAPLCGDHVDHCPMQLLPSVASSASVHAASLPAPVFVPAVPAATSEPARGPPLAFAPKTGPPLTA